MRFTIVHEIKGRIRLHIPGRPMSMKDADILQYSLLKQPFITAVKVYERNQDAVVCYTGKRENVIAFLQKFSYQTANVPDYVWQNSGRKMNREYGEKIVRKIVLRVLNKLFLPMPVRTAVIGCRSARYMWKGARILCRGKVEVPVLDGTAIAVSLLRGDRKTADSVMFLLGIGEILEEWTHKKSVDDLARSMALNISKVWMIANGREVLTDTDKVHAGDHVVIRMGNVIPFDGVVVQGSGAVNQSSMTGEALPVPKEKGGYVYAGTVLEEGELRVCVRETSGSNKYEKIVQMN